MKEEFALFDFHSHSFLSDGELSPIELIRRACVVGYSGIAITDHVAYATLERVISELGRDCELAEKYWDIRAIAGVEITHAPVGSIAEIAKAARELGAELVIVHGETLAEPVEPGTNLAAVGCGWVDLLAHPGLITHEEGEEAARNGVFLELTNRPTHRLTNGHVFQIAVETNSKLLVCSDAHSSGDLLNAHRAKSVALGTGMDDEKVSETLVRNPQLLLQRISEGR